MFLLIALVVESPPLLPQTTLRHSYPNYFWTRSVYCIMFEPAHPSVLVCNPTRYILKNEMTWTQSHGCNRLWMVLVLPMKLKKPKVQKSFPYSTQTNLMTPLPETMATQPFHLPPSGNIRKSHRCDSPRLSWKTRTDCTCASCGPCRLKMDFPCDFFHMESVIGNWVSFRRFYRFPVWSRVFHECTHLKKLLG